MKTETSTWLWTTLLACLFLSYMIFVAWNCYRTPPNHGNLLPTSPSDDQREIRRERISTNILSLRLAKNKSKASVNDEEEGIVDTTKKKDNKFVEFLQEIVGNLLDEDFNEDDDEEEAE